MPAEDFDREVRGRLVRGYLIPDGDAVEGLVKALREDLKVNDKLRREFETDPRQVLSRRGVVNDLVNEIMVEQFAADCSGTCVSTGSCCCETL